MDIPNISGILQDILSKCGFISALSVVVAVTAVVQLTRVRTAWDAYKEKESKRLDEYREKATQRLDDANATIIRLLESSSQNDEKVAVALEGLKTLLFAIQSRGNRD